MFEEKITSTERIFTGKMIKLDRLTVELMNGKQSTREVVRHPGAVGVIALTDDARIVLVKQYRVTLERETLEIPAGKLDPGEGALECARRELAEETGVIAHNMKFLMSMATSIGFADEMMHFYMATDLEFHEANPDEDEFIAVELMPVEDLINLVLDGRVEDGKTVVAGLLCDAFSHRLGVQ